MRKEKEQTINGIKFKITQLGFADGMELLTTLGRIIGPALSDPQKVKNPAALIGDIIGRLSFAEISSIPLIVHRIVASRFYRASLIEVQRHWSIDDWLIHIRHSIILLMWNGWRQNI